MDKLAKNLEIINKKIKENSLHNKITLIAVSKTFDQAAVLKAINLGINCFGENKVQECSSKFDDLVLKHNNLKIHMVGPLQRNKVKISLKLFDSIHTIDRENLVNEINKNISKDSKTKEFFIQVNTGKEIQKSGIFPDKADDFIKWCKEDIGLNIVGLMCIPPVDENPKNHFLNLKTIAEKNNLSKLSMGMTDDYELALSMGATHIRLGTALFGKREYA